MDNIEKALDNFFQRLGHTPGPWWIDDDEFVAAGSGDNYQTVADPHCSHEDPVEREANTNLIAQSPAMLRTLCRTYLFLLTQLTGMYLPLRIRANDTLAILRGQISDATGIDGKEVQDTFEQYALWIQIGADVDEQIKEQAEKDDMMLDGDINLNWNGRIG